MEVMRDGDLNELPQPFAFGVLKTSPPFGRSIDISISNGSDGSDKHGGDARVAQASVRSVAGAGSDGADASDKQRSAMDAPPNNRVLEQQRQDRHHRWKMASKAGQQARGPRHHEILLDEKASSPLSITGGREGERAKKNSRDVAWLPPDFFKAVIEGASAKSRQLLDATTPMSSAGGAPRAGSRKNSRDIAWLPPQFLQDVIAGASAKSRRLQEDNLKSLRASQPPRQDAPTAEPTLAPFTDAPGDAPISPVSDAEHQSDFHRESPELECHRV